MLHSHKKRKGDWIQTYTGKKFWLLDPRPEDICIEDIGHALSLICRFGGHCRSFYCVAQHSLYCSEQSDEEHAFQLLMHDATEAYCGDIVRPFKPFLTNYNDIEENILLCIRKKFKFDYDHKYVKIIDNRMLATEVRDIIPSEVANTFHIVEKPYIHFRIVPWSSSEAEFQFLKRFGELYGKRKVRGKLL